MDRMKLAPAEQERACRTLRAMLACLHERTYMDNLRRLEVMDARFGRYFRRVWHAQKELWAGFRRNGIVPWCAGVNDRVEALVQFLQVRCLLFSGSASDFFILFNLWGLSEECIRGRFVDLRQATFLVRLPVEHLTTRTMHGNAEQWSVIVVKYSFAWNTR